jgi:hypothetical protein
MMKPGKGAAAGTGAIRKSIAHQFLGRGEKDGITGSAALPRMMGNYSKTPPAYLASGGEGASGPGMPHPGVSEIRGGSGGMKTHPKFGGLGPGTMGAMGPANPDATKDPDLS